MQIDSSTILVTGGSSGLGAACVEMLARRGASVIVADVTEPKQHLPQEFSDRVLFVATDVTSESDVCSAIAAGENQFGPLRGVVACAGLLHAERVLGRDGAASLEAFRRVIEVNLIGTFNAVRLAAEAIARSEPREDGARGVVVMTSSISAFEGQIGQAAYAASKGGVASLTLPLAREFGQKGIRVVSIAPGVFDTPMMQVTPNKVRQSLVDQIPFPHRFGHAHEFASLVCQVFENDMLNGCILRLDGALRMGPK
ncbi:MAG TPA: SDR family NAD(P)-dependent oxidoreductase [Lacipirellulaceae bacterium]|nr:SDR family NAD(P)-dependent oxidoreductase [Lacipirellulaceae bacterium]